MKKDQLKLQKNQFTQKFQEKPIKFPPTYKLQIDKNTYQSGQVFGWTDRILTRKTNTLHQVTYNSEGSVFGSDHRPVLARFENSQGQNIE